MTVDERELLSELPPSAKLVYKVLDYNGEMTQKQIVEESKLSARTARYAIKRLESAGVVEEEIHFADDRQNLYLLTSRDSTESDNQIVRIAIQWSVDRTTIRFLAPSPGTKMNRSMRSPAEFVGLP